MAEKETEAEIPRPTHPQRKRSQSPILDLAAEEPRSDSPAGTAHRPDPSDDAAHNPIKPVRFDIRLMATVLIGGIVGGALTAGALYFLSPNPRFSDRLAALETRIAQVPVASALKAVETRQSKAEDDLAAVRQSLGQIPKTSPDLAALTARLRAMEDALAQLSSGPTSAEAAPNKAVLRVSLAALLQSHLVAGAPFDQELALLIALSGPSNETESLKPLAPSGIATYEALARDLLALNTAPQEIESSEPKTPTTIGDRFISGLSHFVTITAVEPSAPARKIDLTEIERAVANRQGSKALEIWQSLPEPARQSLSPWAVKLQTRQRAEAAGEALMREALRALEPKGAGQ